MTPKFHVLMDHAFPQLKALEGFGDMLEDDVEKCHQDMIRFEARYGKLSMNS